MQQNQLHWNFVSTVKAAERQRHLDSGRAKKALSEKTRISMYLDHLSQQFFISDSASHTNVTPLRCLKVSSRNFAAHWRYRKYMAAEQNKDSMTHRHRTRNQSNKSKFQNNYLLFFLADNEWNDTFWMSFKQEASKELQRKCLWRSSKENLTGVRLHQLSIHHQWTWITGWQWLRALFLSCHALSSKHVWSCENSCPWWSRWKFVKLMEIVWNEMIGSTAKNWILHNTSGLCPGLSSVHLQLFSDLGSKMLRRREKGVGYWAIASNFP